MNMKRVYILTYPDKGLKEISKEILKITPEIKSIAEDLREIIKVLKCYGISAVQIGKPLRMFARTKNYLHDVLINPEITWMSISRMGLREGCLSLPWISLKVKRSVVIKVKATTLDGGVVAFTAHGLEAQILQHELDHMDGMMVLDRVSKMTRRLLRNKLKRIIRARKRV